ncbi:hypothetical protein NP233_g9719 [Leucocoprinus birnbaumii]|uniref:Uncharacterized protein n=1 Tax=Leucocoprinus birnbaumii TaxID=56174 RepID=A0AAD5VKL2_9AGAR|nr:hypothetical protein NP233_g9719 [Leucocoprinus birnbaumii]
MPSTEYQSFGPLSQAAMGDKYLSSRVIPKFALPRTLACLIHCGHGPHLSAPSSQQMTPPFSKSVAQASVDRCCPSLAPRAQSPHPEESNPGVNEPPSLTPSFTPSSAFQVVIRRSPLFESPLLASNLEALGRLQVSRSAIPGGVKGILSQIMSMDLGRGQNVEDVYLVVAMMEVSRERSAILSIYLCIACIRY